MLSPPTRSPPRPALSVHAISICLLACDAKLADSGSMDPGAEESDSADTSVEVYGDSNTDDVLCAWSDSGDQRLVYDLVDPRSGTSTAIDTTETFTAEWSCAGEARTVRGNGIPNHTVSSGQFATAISAQDVTISMPLHPEHVGNAADVKVAGYALNSVKFDPATAGTCPDAATTDRDCDYGQGRDSWNMVATPGDTSPWRFDFGVDENDAHVQPSGEYHYHGEPLGLVATLNPDADTRMTLMGWALDGFPMYSVMGVSDLRNPDSSVVKVTSSWQTLASPPADRPSTEDFPMGHFEQDWQYVEGSGDLDVCNGHFAATPEFPDGVYHYHTTETYPFVQRCVNGNL